MFGCSFYFLSNKAVALKLYLSFHAMAKSLIEELPRIASEGRQEAQRIIERLSSGTRIGLQTNELVLPRKDVSGFFRGQVPNIPNAFNAALDGGSWMNRLVYGDNLLTMQALLAGDPQTGLPSLRGKVDLIYIDPPFDSKADYRTKIKLPGLDLQQKPTVIEQFAYADTWEEGTISYLKMLYPRLVLMKELLSERGSIYVHIDWHIGHYLKILLDDIFGKDSFINELVWCYTGPTNQKRNFPRKHDCVLLYSKTGNYIFNADNVRVPFVKSNKSGGKTSFAGKKDELFLEKLDEKGIDKKINNIMAVDIVEKENVIEYSNIIKINDRFFVSTR